jgi:membrane-bound metal-dependent hydrolase YbcI (DUF457 family)
MDVVADALWAGAGAEALRRRIYVSTKTVAGIVLLAVLPDVVHLAPLVVWVLSGDAPFSLVYDTIVALPGREPPLPETVHLLGTHLYFIMHSAIAASAATMLVWVVRRRFPVVLLGWWSHIAIDMFTHSGDYYAVPVLYPITYRGPRWLATRACALVSARR